MQTRQIIFWRLPSQVVVSLFLLSILVACGGPGVPNKTVYAVSQNGTIYAVNGKDGTIRWRYHMAGDNGSPWGASNGLELVNGVIYTSSSVSGGYIYALQARDSGVLWHVKVNPEGTPGTPTLMHDIVYVAVADASSTGSQIYALKAGNGSLIWKITITSPVSLGMPIVLDNTIYISAQTDSGQGYLYALNARDGLVRWHTQLSSWASSNIVVANGIAYTDDNNSDVYAISTHNGALIWQRHFQILHPNDVHISNLAVANGLVYVGVEQGFLYALRASDGVQQWKVQVADIGDHGVYEPTIAGNVI